MPGVRAMLRRTPDRYPQGVTSEAEPGEPPEPPRVLRVPVSGHPRAEVRVQVHHPDAPVVALFEAGLGLPLEVWHPVVLRLPGVCCILTDRPGLGGSTPWERPPVLADQVELICDVLAASSPDPGRPVALVGHSYAGILVEAFSRLNPSRVSALVLVDPSLPEQEAASETLVERFPDLARGLTGQLSWLGRWLGWAFAIGGTAGVGTGDPAASRSIADAYENPVHQLAAVEELLGIGGDAAELIDLTERRPLPDVPVGIIAATRIGGPLPLPKDAWVRDLTDRAEELGPHTQVIQVEGAHLLMLDNPDDLAAAISSILEPGRP